MSGKIYFVCAPGRIKIGYTKKPELRLAQLRAVDMEELTTLSVMDGTMYIEHKLHDMARQFSIRGEWFRDCPEVRQIIDDFVTGKIVFNKFGEELVDEALPKETDPFDRRFSALDAAVKESLAIADEIGKRIDRGESISDLVRSAHFLAKNIIGPALHGPR